MIFHCQCLSTRMPFYYNSCLFLDIDECAYNQPCENGGACNNFAGGYNCSCAAGFDGNHCQNGGKQVYKTLSDTSRHFSMIVL